MARNRQGSDDHAPKSDSHALDNDARRGFLARAGALAIGAGMAPALAAQEATRVYGVTPDLMHEHGLILRVLLIYGEFRDRLSSGKDADPKLLAPVVNLMSTAVHGHHEKIEEEIVFAQLRGDDAHEALISRLSGQHAIGRELTATIGRGADPKSGRQLGKDRFIEALDDFIVLYAPHEAREDTVVFPAFEKQVSREQITALEQEAAERERSLLGEGWFAQAVDQVATVERALGIHELEVRKPRQ